MKAVIVLEDTPQGVSFDLDIGINGTTDHFADSLANHLAAYLYQHIEHQRVLGALVVTQENEHE